MTPAQTILTLPEQLKDTTVDISKLMRYLLQLPRYLEAGEQQGLDAHTRYYLALADGIDFWMRRYLVGRTTTLRQVFREIRDLQELNPIAAQQLAPCILDSIHATLVREEWFELVPKFLSARKRIQKTFQI
ncbi:hypothetical protein GCM10028805_54260 [Spirosoma harenae]